MVVGFHTTDLAWNSWERFVRNFTCLVLVPVAMNDNHQILEDLYLSASKPSSLGGVNRLWKEARKKIPGIKKEEVKEFLQT